MVFFSRYSRKIVLKYIHFHDSCVVNTSFHIIVGSATVLGTCARYPVGR